MHKLTEGNITKQLITLALPLIIGNFLQQLYNTIDAWVVGRYIGQEAFAAIGIGGTVMNLFIFVLMGACTGVGILWAQLYGKGDLPAFRRQSFLALAAGTVFTLLLSLLAYNCTEAMLLLLATPGSILALVSEYLRVIFLGLIMTFLYNYYSTLLRAVGNTLMALVFLAIALAINLLLALLFVAEWHWGIAGAGWATVLAQAASVVLCNFYLRRQDQTYPPGLLLRPEASACPRLRLVGSAVLWRADRRRLHAGLQRVTRLARRRRIHAACRSVLFSLLHRQRPRRLF